jgi:hypothetical protein
MPIRCGKPAVGGIRTVQPSPVTAIATARAATTAAVAHPALATAPITSPAPEKATTRLSRKTPASNARTVKRFITAL